MDIPKRKPLRLKGYDYSQNGAYFITVCTYGKKCLFGNITVDGVGADSISARMLCAVFEQTVARYQQVGAPKYVVMPNHFHAIITIERADIESAPTIVQLLQSFKRHSTLEYIKLVKGGVVPPFDKRVWQRSYYDHIIRNEQEYLEIWKYIDSNPAKWQEDRFYMP